MLPHFADLSDDRKHKFGKIKEIHAKAFQSDKLPEL